MPKRRLLVVGWDSADWKIINPLLAAGQMPMLAKLLSNGVRGNLATLEPSLSPMLWTTIATSRHPAEHGVHGFTEVRDGRVVPVSAATRRCRAVWDILSSKGLKTNLVGWFATQGGRDPNVQLVSNLHSHAPKTAPATPADWPAPPPGTYFPESLGETLDALRLHPTELGGDILSMFVKDAASIDQSKDPRLFQLAEKLAEAFTVQAAATHLMEADDWDLTMVYFRAIDEICHLFMPFHPPRMAGAPEADFARYHDVVNSAYRLHDLLLTRLVDLAGPEAGVMLLSDHGFHSDHLRPKFTPRIPAGIVVWHRHHGIFAASGEGFKKSGEIFGARLPDITPTILAWFGLPRSREMEGRVLRDALESAEIPADIPTWETPGAAPEAAPPVLDEAENKRLLEHFVALGYIAEIPDQPDAAAEGTRRENSWQLASALFHSGRDEEALPLLEEVHHAAPQRPDFAQRLAHCQIRLGLADEAAATIERTLASFRDETTIDLIRANIAQLRGDHAAALSILEKIRAARPDAPGLAHQLARSFLKLRRWNEAESVARLLLESDPANSTAWATIARCRLHQDDNEACIAAALEAIGLDFNSPFAHLALGTALARTGRYDEAATAFRNTISLAPSLIPAYRLLAQTLQKAGHPNEAATCMAQARYMRSAANEAETLRRGRVLAAAKKRQAERDARPKPPAPPPIEPLDLVIVTGLPRSGTSLMMQMLAAGGLEPMTDGQRQPDADNPRGFLEWEEIKQLPKYPRLLSAAAGKAVKVVTPLLPHLPRAHRYKVIFMRRPAAEIVRSQFEMLRRSGKEPDFDAAELAKKFETGVESTLRQLRAAKQVEVLEIEYPSLVADPVAHVGRLVDFLGKEILPTPENMASAVDPALHRQRENA